MWVWFAGVLLTLKNAWPPKGILFFRVVQIYFLLGGKPPKRNFYMYVVCMWVVCMWWGIMLQDHRYLSPRPSEYRYVSCQTLWMWVNIYIYNTKPSKIRPLHPCLPPAFYSSKSTQVKWVVSGDLFLLYLLRLSTTKKIRFGSVRDSRVLGDVIIVLVKNKEVDYVRCNLHSVMNFLFQNFIRHCHEM